MALSREAKAAAVSLANRRRQSHLKTLGRQTGPKSEAGKLASARRAVQHDGRSQGAEAVRHWVASINRLTRALNSKIP